MQSSAEGGIAVKELEFMELLGELPAEYIDAASAPRPKQRRFAWLRYGIPAMAACIAVVILAAVYPRLKSPEIPSVATEPAVTEITVTADAVSASDITTAENGITAEQEPGLTKTTASGETQTLTQSEAAQEPKDGTQKADSDPAQTQENHTEKPAETHVSAAGDKTKPQSSTTAKHVTTRATTRATARVTTTARQVTTRVTTRVTTAQPKVTTRLTMRTTTRTTAATTAHTTAAATYATFATKAAETEAAQSTRPAGTSDQHPIDGSEPSTIDPDPTTDEPTVPKGNSDDVKVMKWQTYNPDPRSEELDCTWEILTERPAGDEYVNLDRFDFGQYNCLLIHLKTHATDATLIELLLSRRDAYINGIVFRQQYDPTQRHFMFAVAVPKNFEFAEEPEFKWNLTGDAEEFYSFAQDETYVWFN